LKIALSSYVFQVTKVLLVLYVIFTIHFLRHLMFPEDEDVFLRSLGGPGRRHLTQRTRYLLVC
jgi:hypothetical protein